MINGKLNNSHYLSISCPVIVKNRIIHYILFCVEIYYLFFIILDIYSKDFKINQTNRFNSRLLFLIIILNKLTMEIRFIIYSVFKVMKKIMKKFMINYLLMKKILLVECWNLELPLIKY